MLINRPAVLADRPSIVALWKAAFPEDSEDFSEAFLSLNGTKHCYVATEDERLISMVFGLPVTHEGKQLQYIYAAATLPAYRGRGVFGELLRFALARAKEAGCIGSFLHPATPSLIDYYARFGYRPWTYCERLSGTAAAGQARRLPVPEYIERRAALLPPSALQWDEVLLFMGGECAFETEHAVALCDLRGETLYIKEWLGEGNPAAVCAAVGCVRYELVRQAAAGEVYTLLLPFTEDVVSPPYIGPVFD